MSSSPTASGDDLEPWELEAVEAVIRSFVGGRGGSIDGWLEADLVQECLVHWWRQRDRYNAARGANQRTYLNRVCKNYLIDLARKARTRHRWQGGAVSLDVPVTEDGDDLADLIADDAPGPEDEVLAGELDQLLARARGGLSSRQRDVLDALRADPDRTRAGIARDLGISRDTLYEDIRRIRDVCREAGLEDFLR